jgi:peptidylprolyl isomerase
VIVMVARARAGDRVKVQYSGTSQDGTAIGTRRAPQVLEFTVGSDDVMPGIDKGVVGMAQGEQKKMTLQPSDGYGAVEKKLIKSIPRQRFPTHLQLHVGKRLNSKGMSTGRHWLVHVVKILPDTVVVDANHPLAGKTLNVEMQLVSLASPGDA